MGLVFFIDGATRDPRHQVASGMPSRENWRLAHASRALLAVKSPPPYPGERIPFR
jgi:hypothetical protein